MGSRTCAEAAAIALELEIERTTPAGSCHFPNKVAGDFEHHRLVAADELLAVPGNHGRHEGAGRTERAKEILDCSPEILMLESIVELLQSALDG